MALIHAAHVMFAAHGILSDDGRALEGGEALVRRGMPDKARSSFFNRMAPVLHAKNIVHVLIRNETSLNAFHREVERTPA